MNLFFLLRTLKFKIKRIIRFYQKGGVKFLSISGVVDSIKWHMSNSIKPKSSKTIYWIGPFSPIHANVGDHAQTLGVKNFLQDKFADYRIVRIYRDDITEQKLTHITKNLRPSDLIILHSSGDFGSLHDVLGHHPGRLSFPEVRRQVVKQAPANKIINLPTTAFYEDTQSGEVSLVKDQEVFNNSNLTVLCREEVSLQVLQDNLECRSRFFPDFVFYLKPKPYASARNGTLVILRDDKEAVLTRSQKQSLIEKLGEFYDDIEVKDIMHASHTIPDFILEKYMDGVFKQFQKRELIVTDKMHGMITAVITQTPCIALSGGIPHKIKAYKSFLSGVVEFVEDASDIDDAVNRIRGSEHLPVDLTEYFDRFREEVSGV